MGLLSGADEKKASGLSPALAMQSVPVCRDIYSIGFCSNISASIGPCEL